MHPDLVPYHLTCDQHELMPQHGPPDFYPLVPVSSSAGAGARTAGGQQQTSILHQDSVRLLLQPLAADSSCTP